MCYKSYIIIHLLLTLNFISNNTADSNCDQENCASIVSKCMLTKSCKCERKNISCYKDCFRCLGKKYFQPCCSCFDLCPKGDVKTILSQKSYVEDFVGAPELFDMLFSSPNNELQNIWSIVKFSVNCGTLLSSSNLETNEVHSSAITNDFFKNIFVDCTVLYFAHCVSWNKCRQICRSTGASSYRWFHDGCCECVGSNCLDYGLNESRCKLCPENNEEFDENFEEDNSLDFENFNDNFEKNEI